MSIHCSKLELFQEGKRFVRSQPGRAPGCVSRGIHCFENVAFLAMPRFRRRGIPSNVTFLKTWHSLNYVIDNYDISTTSKIKSRTYIETYFKTVSGWVRGSCFCCKKLSCQKLDCLPPGKTLDQRNLMDPVDPIVHQLTVGGLTRGRAHGHLYCLYTADVSLQ